MEDFGLCSGAKRANTLVMRWLCCAMAALVACSSGSKSSSKSEEKTRPEHEPVVDSQEGAKLGLELFARFECNRCHEGTAIAKAPPNKQCVGCHEQILAGRYQGASPQLVATWRENIHSLPLAPSLLFAGRKFRRQWVRDQLLRPVDVRPALQASMPRLAISRAEAERLAEALVPEEARPERFPELAVQRGAALFEELSCDACHAFGERAARPRSFTAANKNSNPAHDALLLAPDLAHTRERFQSGRLVAWLMDPASVQPGTKMPNFKLSRSEATSLAAYLWHRPVAPVAAPLPARLPPLEREVGWDEVFEKVLKTVCWHCHASADFAMGDGGPGNTGGFGYQARGLDLSSYEALRSGSFGADGRRRSITRAGEDGTSLLVRSMLARQREERGDFDPEIIGMPLGFPAMSPEQIQLVESWIAQGRPR